MIALALIALLVGNEHRCRLHIMKEIALHQRPNQASFSQHGRYLAVTGEYGAVIYSTSDWSRVRPFHLDASCVTSIHGTSGFLMEGSDKVYVIVPGTKPKTLDLPSLGTVTHNLGISTDGKTLGVCVNRAIRLYSVLTRKRISIKDGPEGYIGQLVGTDSGVAVSIFGYPEHSGGAIYVYSTDNSTPTIVPSPATGLYALAYSTVTKTLYAGGNDGRLFAMNIADRKLRYLCRPGHDLINNLSVSPDGALVAIGYKRDYKRRRGMDLLLLLESRSGRTLAVTNRTRGVQGLDFAPDGKTLAEIDRGGTLRLYRYH